MAATIFVADMVTCVFWRDIAGIAVLIAVLLHAAAADGLPVQQRVHVLVLQPNKPHHPQA